MIKKILSFFHFAKEISFWLTIAVASHFRSASADAFRSSIEGFFESGLFVLAVCPYLIVFGLVLKKIWDNRQSFVELFTKVRSEVKNAIK